MENSNHCVVMTTCSNREDAHKIISALLNEQLAACIQIFDVTSFYFWKGAVNTDPEVMLFVKSKEVLYSQIEECIKANHNYETPEIIQVPIVNGAASYLNWMNEVTK